MCDALLVGTGCPWTSLIVLIVFVGLVGAVGISVALIVVFLVLFIDIYCSFLSMDLVIVAIFFDNATTE